MTVYLVWDMWGDYEPARLVSIYLKKEEAESFIGRTNTEVTKAGQFNHYYIEEVAVQ